MNILCVDDNERFLKILGEILSPLGLVTMANNSFDAIRCLKNIKYDLILLDINLTEEQNLDGIELIADIKKICDTKIIMLTGLTENKVIRKAIQMGAAWYIEKMNIANIVELIKTYMSTSYVHDVIACDYRETTLTIRLNKLSSKEKEVLTMASNGLKMKTIADELLIKIDTVKQHYYSINCKLNTKSMKESIEFYKMGV